MRYAAVINYDDAQFRRLTGVRKSTFQRMVEILAEAHIRKKAEGGRPNKVTIPEMRMRPNI